MKQTAKKGRVFTDLTPREQIGYISRALDIRRPNKVSIKKENLLRILLDVRVIIGKFFVAYDGRYFSLESWRNFHLQGGSPLTDGAIAKLLEAMYFFKSHSMTPNEEGLFDTIPKRDRDLHLFAALPELITAVFGSKAEMRLSLIDSAETSRGTFGLIDIFQSIEHDKPYYTLREVLVKLIYHKFGVTWFGQLEAYRVMALLSGRIAGI